VTVLTPRSHGGLLAHTQRRRVAAKLELAEAQRKLADAESELAWLAANPPGELAECGRHLVGSCQPSMVEGELCRSLTWQHLPLP
jgi:hypothetical protein